MMIECITTGILLAFLMVQSNSCEMWYWDLGTRLDTLHERFYVVVQKDPDGVSLTGKELVNDYKTIHQETTRFNTECAISGFNIPKFSD